MARHTKVADPAATPAQGAGTSRGATFRELTPDECRALLARRTVGRLAYTFHDRVGIEPLHYAYEDGRVYGRTSPGSKLTTLAHHPWVAFEVDEVAGVFEWRSVVARGTFYRIERDGTAAQRASWQRAVQLLGAIVPGMLTPADPVPFRDVVFYIHVDEMTGRAAMPAVDRTADLPPAAG